MYKSQYKMYTPTCCIISAVRLEEIRRVITPGRRKSKEKVKKTEKKRIMDLRIENETDDARPDDQADQELVSISHYINNIIVDENVNSNANVSWINLTIQSGIIILQVWLIINCCKVFLATFEDLLHDSSVAWMKLVEFIFDVLTAKYNYEIWMHKSKLLPSDKNMLIIGVIIAIIIFAGGFVKYRLNDHSHLLPILLKCCLASVWIIILKFPTFLRILKNYITAVWLFRRSSTSSSSPLSEEFLAKYKLFTETNVDIAFINIIGYFLPMTINKVIMLMGVMKKCPDLEKILEAIFGVNLIRLTLNHHESTIVEDDLQISSLFSMAISVISFPALAWCLTARARSLKARSDDKIDLSLPRSLVLCFAHLFLTVSRCLMISCMLNAAPITTTVLLLSHWIGGAVYVWWSTTEDEEDTAYVSKVLHWAVFGIIYVFATIISPNYDKPKGNLYIGYYAICSIELVVFAITWPLIQDCYTNSVDAISIVTVIIVSFVVGIVFFVAYYWFRSIPNDYSRRNNNSIV